jgi:hypothetical protein
MCRVANYSPLNILLAKNIVQIVVSYGAADCFIAKSKQEAEKGDCSVREGMGAIQLTDRFVGQ